MGTSPKSSDELEILHVGATIPELAAIFGTGIRETKSKIIGRVPPGSLPHRTPVRYPIKDAAPFLCKVEVDIEEAIKNIPASKLPPMLQAPFWAAQRDKLKYMEEVGRLWSSERVIEIFGKCFKPMKMAILMVGEKVSMKTELNETQRKIISDEMDALLLTVHSSLVAEFENYRPKDDEHGTPLAGTEVLDTEEEEEAFDDGLND